MTTEPETPDAATPEPAPLEAMTPHPATSVPVIPPPAAPAPETVQTAPPANAATFFNGRSNRKRTATLRLATAGLEIVEDGMLVDVWPYASMRRADGPRELLRLRSVTALPLSRVEVADPALQAAIAARCPSLDLGEAKQTWRIVVLVARRRHLDRAARGFRRSDRRRPPGAVRAAGLRAASRRGGRQAGRGDLRRQALQRRRWAGGLLRRWPTSSSAPVASTSS